MVKHTIKIAINTVKSGECAIRSLAPGPGTWGVIDRAARRGAKRRRPRTPAPPLLYPCTDYATHHKYITHIHYILDLCSKSNVGIMYVIEKR